MTAIFNNYHSLPYDLDYINSYVNEYLSKDPGGFEKDELSTFFAQHVALETIYHLRLSGHYPQVVKFLNDTANFHNQVSAARALATYNSAESKALLLGYVTNKDRSEFVKVMCIWSLKELKPSELKSELTKIKNNSSEEENGFGGNIMDPRVCTAIPSVKEALEDLIGKL